ncbi:hypothetical protein PoB_003582500 [Plakobranchus ocellatus]|uniref:Uncharacterized protein n=1 Tax=Plakobranchus ocellatus TaxID=259542 RepID=A0AAV4APN6_9GAST|nr:hypothetical protein PoB_003582500 [Plakobranchus ocellatus]
MTTEHLNVHLRAVLKARPPVCNHHFQLQVSGLTIRGSSPMSSTMGTRRNDHSVGSVYHVTAVSIIYVMQSSNSYEQCRIVNADTQLIKLRSYKIRLCYYDPDLSVVTKLSLLSTLFSTVIMIRGICVYKSVLNKAISGLQTPFPPSLPSHHGTSSRARARQRRVPADLRMGSLSTVPPSLLL